jgi:hypothetical protein
MKILMEIYSGIVPNFPISKCFSLFYKISHVSRTSIMFCSGNMREIRFAIQKKARKLKTKNKEKIGNGTCRNITTTKKKKVYMYLGGHTCNEISQLAL